MYNCFSECQREIDRVDRLHVQIRTFRGATGKKYVNFRELQHIEVKLQCPI